MTDEEAKALGLRALLAGFQLQHAVLDTDGCRQSYNWFDGKYGRLKRALAAMKLGSEEPDEYGRSPQTVVAGYLPDFRDAATRGVLLEQVRESCKDALLVPLYHPHHRAFLTNAERWSVRITPQPTEVHALVAVLEAARGEG